MCTPGTAASPCPAAPPALATLLGLQRLAGNAAVVSVVRHVGSSSAPAGRDAVAAGPATGTGSGTAEPTVQRKVGFEFQTGNNFIGRLPGDPAPAPGTYAAAPHARVPIVGEKVLAYRDDTLRFKVEGDQGADDRHFNIEFITDAADNVGQALKSVTAASDLAREIGSAPRGRLEVRKGQSMGSGTWRRDALMEINDPSFSATPQGSVGIELGKVGQFLEDASRDSHEVPQKHVLESVKAAPKLAALAGPKLTAAGQGLLQLIAYYLAAAKAPAPTPHRRSRYDEVFGSLYNKEWFEGPEELIPDGPKASFFVMARTDFHQMFLSLQPDDQTGVQAALLDDKKDKQVVALLGRALDGPVLTGRYRADPAVYGKMSDPEKQLYDIRLATADSGKQHPVVFRSPTVRDWLRSIVTGHGYMGGVDLGDRKGDVLSAPPGWGSRQPENKGTFPTGEEIQQGSIYGMGAYPMDRPSDKSKGGLAVLELRGLLDSLKADHVKAVRWPDMAEEVIKRYMRASGLT